MEHFVDIIHNAQKLLISIEFFIPIKMNKEQNFLLTTYKVVFNVDGGATFGQRTQLTLTLVT